MAGQLVPMGSLGGGYNLINKIMPMRQVKGLTLPGLTGNLTIDNNNQVTRVLPRAKITTKQIEQISGE